MENRPVGDRPVREPPATSPARPRGRSSWWIPVLAVVAVLAIGWVWGWGTWFGTHPSNGTFGSRIVTSTPMGNATAGNRTITGKAPPTGPAAPATTGAPARPVQNAPAAPAGNGNAP